MRTSMAQFTDPWNCRFTFFLWNSVHKKNRSNLSHIRNGKRELAIGYSQKRNKESAGPRHYQKMVATWTVLLVLGLLSFIILKVLTSN